MVTSIRRHWLTMVAFAFFFVNGILTIGVDAHPMMHVLRIVLGVIGLAGLIRSLQYRNVFEFRENQLIWYRTFLPPLTIDRENIKSIQLETRAMRNSRINLKNGVSYAFSTGMMSFNEIRMFMRHAGIAVNE